MDLIRQYLASPEFAEAIGNVVVIAIMATAAGIDWKIYGRKTRRRTPPSIDTPQRRRRAAQRRTCLLYTSPSPRDATLSRMPSSA